MSGSEIKRAFLRYLQSIGKNDEQAKAIATFIEKDSPVNFFVQVGMSRTQYVNAMNVGGIRTLTRKNKATFNEVYLLYGKFIEKAASKHAAPKSAKKDVRIEPEFFGLDYAHQSPGYANQGPGLGRARRSRSGVIYGNASQAGEGLMIAITKVSVLFFMLLSLCGDWFMLEEWQGWYATRGYTLLEISLGLGYLRSRLAASFGWMLALLIIAIVLSVIILFWVIRPSRSAMMESLSQAGMLRGFMAFIKYVPLYFHLAFGIVTLSLSSVIANYFFKNIGYYDIKRMTAAPAFMITLAILLLVIVSIQIAMALIRRSPRRGYR